MIKIVLASVRKICVWTLTSIGILAAFSCQDDMLEKQQTLTGDKITFVPWTAVLSRSIEPTSLEVKESRHFLTVIGKDSIFLHILVEDNASPIFADTASSRAASQTTGQLTSFYIDAFLDNGSEFMRNQLVEKKSGNWEYSPVKYWPNNEGAEVHFGGYVKTKVDDVIYLDGEAAPSYTYADGVLEGTFSHTLPGPNMTDNKDAECQPDLIFAMAPNQSKQSVSGAVQLKFYHALSAIVFKVGDMPEGTKITNLTIANVKEGGSCVMTEATGGGIHFDWTPGETLKTYTQAFNKADVKKGDDISEDATTFMMIPQTLTDESHLVIRFTIGEHKYEYKHPLIIMDEDGKMLSNVWESNKKYIYTLSTTEVVEVDVTDQVTGENQTVKELVKIKNTGLTPSYIRAAIVGYWVNEGGDIVASWKADDETIGTFTGLCGEGWIQGKDAQGEDDGFYYHKVIVPPGQYTSDLFTKYELTGNPPIVGASLELNIVVQAVKVDTSVPWTGITVSNNELTQSN